MKVIDIGARGRRHGEPRNELILRYFTIGAAMLRDAARSMSGNMFKSQPMATRVAIFPSPRERAK
jgi:hypothetical protein